MKWIVVGLGNPGEKYENTRHNTGRLVLERWRHALAAPPWEPDGKLRALVSKTKIGRSDLWLLCPEGMMNNSGGSLRPLIKTRAEAARLLIIHDDLDLPLGRAKLSFGRGDGGHRGVASVVRAIKTNEFLRLRIGVAPVTPSGKTKKPRGEAAVVKFILGDFKPAELAKIKKMAEGAESILESWIAGGPTAAMNAYPSRQK